MNDDRTALKKAIEAGAILSGQRDEKDEKIRKADGQDEEALLETRLRSRLDKYYELTAQPREEGQENLGELKTQTGQLALDTVKAIDDAALVWKRAQDPNTSDDIPVFGSKDVQTLRLLLGIVSNWSIGLLVVKYDEVLRSAHQSKEVPTLQDVEEEEDILQSRKEKELDILASREALSSVLDKLDSILPEYSPVGRLVLDTCSIYIIAGSIRLGWGPVSLAPGSKQDDIARSGTARVASVLKRLPTTTCLKLLSGVSRIGNVRPRFIKTTTEMLFGAQLLRRDGVMALLRNTFEDVEGNERGLMTKLVGVGQLLSTPPARMPSALFAATIVPRLVEVVGQLPDVEQAVSTHFTPSQQSSPAQKNAACFALARLHEVEPKVVQEAMYSHIYRFICPVQTSNGQAPKEHTLISTDDQLAKAIGLLAEIVNQSEPSSSFASNVLSPIVVSLFVVHSFILETKEQPKIATIGEQAKLKENDQLGDLCSSLFRTWLKLTDGVDVLAVLSPSNVQGLFGLEGKGQGALQSGKVDEQSVVPYLCYEGANLCVRWQRRDDNASLSAAALDKLGLNDVDVRLHGADEKEELALPTQLLASLRQVPSPNVLSRLLKQAERQDLAASLLVTLLDAYALKKEQQGREQESLLHILYLQHIMQLIDAFGSKVLQDQPDKILNFIAFALGHREESVQTGESKESSDTDDTKMPFIKAQKDTSVLHGLFDVGSKVEQVDNVAQDAMSVDAMEDEDDEELRETALNLLLSLLEADPKMTSETHSMLKLIVISVDRLTSHNNASIRSAAKEASLVLKARQSAVSATKTEMQTNDATSPLEQARRKGRAMYQEALRLLQDPILPVRAHGLVMLKDLVSYGTKGGETQEISMDPALIPAILDVFVHAVCDDESFLYLNAVKGLAEMGNTGGHTMIRRLVSIYTGSDTTQRQAMTQAEVDKRLRVGEALLQVVQKLELALSPYTSDIVSPLLTSIRDASLPTTMRSSMLSILGTCIEACPQAMATQGYAMAICDAMLDLLSVEMDVRGTTATAQTQLDDAMSTDAKLPHLRRAALLLLSLLVRGGTMQLQTIDERRQHAAWQEDTTQLTALRMPGGGHLTPLASDSQTRVQDTQSLLFSTQQLARTERVVGYVGQLDSDPLTRYQADQVLQDVETFKMYSTVHVV